MAWVHSWSIFAFLQSVSPEVESIDILQEALAQPESYVLERADARLESGGDSGSRCHARFEEALFFEVRKQRRPEQCTLIWRIGLIFMFLNWVNPWAWE